MVIIQLNVQKRIINTNRCGELTVYIQVKSSFNQLDNKNQLESIFWWHKELHCPNAPWQNNK